MAQKMFLISPQHLNRLSQPIASAPNSGETIRRTAENNLDVKMRAILDERGLSDFEKIKKYNALLQRYLALLKQGELEDRSITLKLAKDSVEQEEEEEKEDKGLTLDETGKEVLQNLPARYRNNAEYILKKLTKSRGGWTPRGEFVYRGDIVKGSHLLDLLKNISFSHKSTQPPKGWTSFLNTLSEVNIPLSLMTNPRAREQYSHIQTRGPVEDEEAATPPLKKGKRRTPLAPRWDTEEPLKKGKRKKKRTPLAPLWNEEEEASSTPLRRGERRRQTPLAPRWLDFTPQ